MLEINTGCRNHSGKLTSCERYVNIRITGSTLIITLRLEFFGGARHDTNNKNVFRINTVFFSIPCLDNSAEHLLRRLTSGKMC